MLIFGYYVFDKEAFMKNTDPVSDNTLNNPVSGNLIATGELTVPTQEKLDQDEPSREKEIDLNALFPDVETNLNDLFPDAEVKHLLKNIIKNKKDMGLIKERLATENKTPKAIKVGENTEDASELDN